MAIARNGRGGGSHFEPWDEIFPRLGTNPFRGRSYETTSAARDCPRRKESTQFCTEEFGPDDVASVTDNPAVQEGARRHVERCTRSMQSYGNNGPSSGPNTPYVCLVAAG